MLASNKESKQVALFGGSFNPPGIHHVKIIKELLKLFSKVIIIPCGPRPDKSSTNEIVLQHREMLSKLAFLNIENTILDLSDLKKTSFTPSIELYNNYSKEQDCYLVVGSDLIQGGASNSSEIQKSWYKGKELWQIAKFAVLSRESSKIEQKDLPPNAKLINISIPGSSKEIRDLLKNNSSIKELLAPNVYQYIQKNNLYK